MKEIRFRAWHVKEARMYYRAYQKWLHILLCEDDRGAAEGAGKPAKRAGYADCVLLESTGLYDKNGSEIFEGDVVRVRHAERTFTDVVGPVPDTFGSRVHPLRDLFAKHGLSGDPDRAEIEVLGNEFESPELLEENKK